MCASVARQSTATRIGVATATPSGRDAPGADWAVLPGALLVLHMTEGDTQSRRIGGVQLSPGLVLELAEADYLYGVGTVRITVTALDDVMVDGANHQWIGIHGEQRFWDGSTRRRFLQARVTALAKAVRHK